MVNESPLFGVRHGVEPRHRAWQGAFDRRWGWILCIFECACNRARRYTRRMSKTIFYKLFGWGKIPEAMLPILQQEGIVLGEEGLSGTVYFKNFRAPGKRYSRRISWFSGSIVLTKKRLAAWSFSKSIINVPVDSAPFNALHFSLKDERTLRIRFDSSLFNEQWSGDIEYRLKVSQPRLFLEHLEQLG